VNLTPLLHDGDPTVPAAPVRRDYEWVRERMRSIALRGCGKAGWPV